MDFFIIKREDGRGKHEEMEEIKDLSEFSGLPDTDVHYLDPQIPLLCCGVTDVACGAAIVNYLVFSAFNLSPTRIPMYTFGCCFILKRPLCFNLWV